MDNERVGPWLVAEEACRYTTDGVKDAEQRDEHCGLILVHFQRDGIRCDEEERGEKACTMHKHTAI